MNKHKGFVMEEKLSLLEYMSEMPDPRQDYKVVHPLPTLLFTTLCAVLCDSRSWLDVHDFCETKKSWLGQYVDLSKGIPSPWTFRRLFILLDPCVIEDLLLYSTQCLKGERQSDQIVIDGKVLCGSKRYDSQCLKSISAWCYDNGLVLAEKDIDAGSHEITAIPFLLEVLHLKGTTVSIDAAGCQTSIAQTLVAKGADYVLALKNNQRKTYETVTTYFHDKQNQPIEDHFDDQHGRSVRRRYFACDISALVLTKEWQGLRSVIAVETISGIPGRKPTIARWRYYLSSHTADYPHLHQYVRHHWGIENKLHWVLDVQMGEDHDTKAERRSAKAFAIIRRIALNIIRTKNTNKKRSLRRVMKCAGWDQDYLLKLLL
jgi:predicted transposase YbfD/YdcC